MDRREQMKRDLPVVLWGLVLFGLLVFFIGGIVAWRAHSRAKALATRGVKVQGTVQNAAKYTEGGRFAEEEVHIQMVAFTDAKGERHQVQTRSGERKFKRGEAVPLVYLPENPEAAIIEGVPESRWGFWSGLGLGILGWLAAAAGGIVKMFQHLAEQRRVNDNLMHYRP